jgi:regulator of protease activity HflC (stomatin/prohibitin superfamily)
VVDAGTGPHSNKNEKEVMVMFELFRRLQVMEYQKAVLYEDGRYVKTLGPGRYWLNRVCPRQETTLVDVRLASLAVAGQEILTADKLGVRLTLVAQYRVADPAKAMTLVQNFANYLYEELQLAMRDIVGARTLDELMARKGALSDELAQKVRPRGAGGDALSGQHGQADRGQPGNPAPQGAAGDGGVREEVRPL